MEEMREKVVSALSMAKNVIYGQDKMLEGIFASLVCEGHILLEGMPGLGKTLSVVTLSKILDLSFKRIQFTPDLLPSDLIGTMIYNQSKEEFSTKFGPVFTQILLADEINRAPAKVQSALLEAMGEKQVTIGEKTHDLAAPFVVLATQNPIDHEGTYPLPEAQMDRFMMKISIDYPDFKSEHEILGMNKNPFKDISPQLSSDDIFEIQDVVEKIYVDEKIKNMIVKIVQATRPGNEFFLKKYESVIQSGAGPRGSIWPYKLSRFYAFLEGKDYVTPDHILKIISDVLSHRIILSYEANIDQISKKDIVMDIAKYYL